MKVVPIKPQLGDYVMIPDSSTIKGPGIVVGFDRGRAIVRSLEHPNITTTVGSKTRIYPEHCTEHSDCRVSPALAIECARWTRQRLASKRAP